MRQNEQKLGQKFCGQKTAKKRKTHPIWAKKGETGCVSGAGEGCSRYGRVGKPEIRTKMHQIAMQHMKKGNRRKPRVSAGFVAGAEGLGLGCRLGCCSPVGSAQHRPRREPRPAQQSATGTHSPLGTRFWSGCGRTHQGAKEGRRCPVPLASPREGGAGLVLREISLRFL